MLGCKDTIRFAAHDTLGVTAGPRGHAVVGSSATSDPVSGSQETHSAFESSNVFELRLMTPNPARAGCDISFALPEPASARLQVFDVSGRLVGSLLDRDVPEGRHAAHWDGAGLADGLYFARPEAGARRATLRVVLTH